MIQVSYIVSRNHFVQILLINDEVKQVKCNHKYCHCNNVESAGN